MLIEAHILYVNRGSCPESLLLKVQCSATKLTSLPDNIGASAVMFEATFILLMKLVLLSVCEHPH